MNNTPIHSFIEQLTKTDNYEEKLDKMMLKAGILPTTVEEIIGLIDLTNPRTLQQTKRINILMLSGHLVKAKHFIDPKKKNFFI